MSQSVHHSQEIVEDAGRGLTVEIEVLITVELVTLILGFGDQVEVAAPEKLKDKVKSALINSLKKYSI